ncbi:hypothetical protein CVP04_12050, partial [Caviibacterium pharyngocola]
MPANIHLNRYFIHSSFAMINAAPNSVYVAVVCALCSSFSFAEVPPQVLSELNRFDTNQQQRQIQQQQAQQTRLQPSIDIRSESAQPPLSLPSE